MTEARHLPAQRSPEHDDPAAGHRPHLPLAAPGRPRPLPAPGDPILRRPTSARSDPLGDTQIRPDLLATLRRRRGSGGRLPERVTADAGTTLGADLSAVRVHTGPEADRIATEVRSVAFSYGSDLYFTRDVEDHTSPRGSQTLAHELAHVAGGHGAGAGARIGRADAPEERQADRDAQRVLPALRRGFRGAGAPQPESALDRIRRDAPPAAPSEGGIHRIAGLKEAQHVVFVLKDQQHKGTIAEVRQGTYLVRYSVDTIAEGKKYTVKKIWHAVELDVDQVDPDPSFGDFSAAQQENLDRRLVPYQQAGSGSDVQYGTEPHKEFGTLHVKHAITDKALKLTVKILSNTDEMTAKRREVDTVPVDLFVGPRSIPLMLVRPTLDRNIATFEKVVPWENLLTAEDLKSRGRATPLQVLSRISPELTVQASWWNNSGEPDHWMGGPTFKGGRGTRILLVQPTPEQVEKSEQRPKTELNALTPLDDDHPVQKANQAVLKAGSDLVTNLEAEAEHTIVGDTPRDTLDRVVTALRRIVNEEAVALRLDLEETEDNTGSPTTYIDTYYDVIARDPSQKDRTLMMLRNSVVLRHRHKPEIKHKQKGDSPGTNLFAVKGRTRTPDVQSEERIRPASQVYLTDGTLPDPTENHDRLPELGRFVSGTDGPPEASTNPFARVVLDALPEQDRALLTGEVEGWLLRPILMITSERRKMALQIIGGPKIDFSADVATATLVPGAELPPDLVLDDSATVCSFEFGVGHPGVGGSAAVSARTDGGPRPQTGEQPGSGKAGVRVVGKQGFENLSSIFNGSGPKGTGSPPEYVFGRTYHVPADAQNPDLLTSPDHLEYQRLRKSLMEKIKAEIKELEVEPGGSKATLLARRMGLLPGS